MKGRKERRKRGRSLTCLHPNNRGFVLKQTNTLNLGIKLSLVLSMIWLPHDIAALAGAVMKGKHLTLV